jgi:hypothetical protein
MLLDGLIERCLRRVKMKKTEFYLKIIAEEKLNIRKKTEYDRIKHLIDSTQEIDVLKIAWIMIENYEKNYSVKSRLRLIFERKLNFLNFEKTWNK